MKETISGLLLFFDVKKTNDRYFLTFNKTKNLKRFWPTIFIRQLDYMQKAGDSLFCVSDTPTDKPFQLVSLNMQKHRLDNVNL